MPRDQTWSFEAKFISPEGDTRNYFAEFITFLNEHFTTQEKMEARYPVLALDFAAKNGFNVTQEFKAGKNTPVFTKQE